MQQSPQPAKRYIAKSLPYGDGRFRAQFAMPGHTPDYVRDNASPVLYRSADEAELAAARVLLVLANDRLRGLRDFDWQPPLTPDELVKGLAEIGMKPADFAEEVGAADMAAWLNGIKPAPHWVRLMLVLLKDQNNRALVAQTNEDLEQ